MAQVVSKVLTMVNANLIQISVKPVEQMISELKLQWC